MPAGPRHRPAIPGKIYVAVVAIVVVAAMVVAFTGLLGSASNRSSGAMTFWEARSLANSTAGAHGSWVLSTAVGVDSARTIHLNLSSMIIASGCNITSFVGTIWSNASEPSFQGNFSTGVAEEWVFDYYEVSGTGGFLVVVTGGALTTAAEMSGADCMAGSWIAESGNSAAWVADSPGVVNNALHYGGTAFLRSHPNGVSMTMELDRGVWGVVWETCSVLPDAYGWIGSGYRFSVLDNGTNTSNPPSHTYSSSCGGPPPIAEAIGFGTPELTQETHYATLDGQGCDVANYCYTLPITKAAFNVTAENLSLGVYLNNSGDNAVVGYAILNETGSVIVWTQSTGTGAGGGLWQPGTGTDNLTLTTKMSLTIDMGYSNPAGKGYSLATEGWGAGFQLSPYFSTPLP